MITSKFVQFTMSILKVRTRVFNCVHSVKHINQGYNWIKFKLEDNGSIIWYRAQMELGKAGDIIIQALFGFKHAKCLGPVKKMFPEASVEITKDTERRFNYCTDGSNRSPGSRLMQKGNFQYKYNSQQWEKDFEYACTLNTVEASMNHMLKTHPKHYCGQMKRLAVVFSSLKPCNDRIKYNIEQFTECRVSEEELSERTIVLVGRSSLGKTNYAKAHFKNPAVVKNKTDLPKITPVTDGIVFDDIEMYTWTPSAVRNIVDLEEGGHHDIKYGSIYIREGLPRFLVICNEDNFWPKSLFGDDGMVSEAGLIDYESIQKRIIIKHIEQTLFDKPAESLQKEFDRSNAETGKTRPNSKTLKQHTRRCPCHACGS